VPEFFLRNLGAVSFINTISQMKKFITIFLITFLFAAGIFAQQWNGLRSDTPTPIQQDLLQSSDESIVVKFNIDGFYMTPVTTPNGREYTISVPEMVSMLEAGSPDLPIYAVSAIIPDLALMKVRVLESSFTDIPNMEIAPSKGNFSRQTDPETVPYTYGEAYQTDAFFPVLQSEIQEAYILRDYRGQAMSVFPFAYNPITKTLRVYTELVIEMYEDGIGGENQFSRTNDIMKLEREFKSIYAHHFINFDDSNRNILDEEGNMLVISHGPYMEAVEPLLDWKKTIGRPIEMVDVSSIGTTTAAIKAFIQDYYDDNGLTHLLLVGDHQHVPSQSMSGGFSDNFYGYLTGNDSYSEVFVGRFSAESVADVETQVQRTIEYERDMDESDTWLNVGLGIARNEGAGNGHNGGEADFVHMDYIRDTLLNYTYSTVWREYDGNVPGVPNTNATIMMQRFNDGVSVTNFCNHGHQNGWSVGNFSSSNVTQLTNNGKLPYIWSVACDNGRFTNGTCFAEVWMRSTHNGEPSGAIATMMSWISQPWQPPMTGQDEMVTILAEKRDHIKRTMAGVSINGSSKMIAMHGSIGISTHDTWILFGDPSLTLRTAAPTPIAVDHMPAAFLGFSEFTVNADAEDAIVTLTMNGEIVGSAYVVDGIAVVEFEPLTEPGEMTVSVFGWNRITYLSTIEVIPAEGPFVALSSSLIDDNQDGNGNGQIDYNETIVLGVELKNLGVEDATNVITTITTDSPYVTIIDGEETYGTIAPDELIMIADAFTFEVADGIPDNTGISFEIEIAGAEDTWYGTMNLTAYAPDISVGNLVINDFMAGNGNGILDPGETANLVVRNNNNGGSQSIETIAQILLNDPYVTVNNYTHEIGVIGPGQLALAVFNVTVSPTAPVGYVFAFDYSLEAGAYSAEKTFSTKVGLIIEDYESGDFADFDWNFSGHQPWTISTTNPYEGTYSAKSGGITHNQQTRMILQFEVGADDSISFFRRVSSESNYDFLKFYINGNQKGSWSGNVAWGKVTYPVSAGTNTFVWEYMKDNFQSSGEDAAWVDFISFPPPITTSGGAGTDAAICETQTHQLEAFAQNYETVEWTTSGTGNFDDPNILNPIYTPSAQDVEEAEVTLTITIEGNNTISDEVLLSIYKNPSVFAGENAEMCVGGMMEITASHGEYYEALVWETSGTGEFDDNTALHPIYMPSAEDFESGMVTLTVWAYGFESCEVAMSTFDLGFHNLPTAQIAGDQTICLGDAAEITFELTGTAPWIVTLANDMGTHTIEASPYTMEASPEVATSYMLLAVTDANNCEGDVSGEATVTLNYAPETPVQPAGQDTIDLYVVSQTVYQIETVENAEAYTWQLEPAEAGELTIDGTTVTIDWDIEYRGMVELVAMAVNDCGMSEASAVLEIELYSTVGLDENSMIQASIYPNPSEGNFTISMSSLRKAEAIVSVRNMMGELVYAESIDLDSRRIDKTLNLNHLSSGNYILSVESNDGLTIKRIIIQK
jgi:hypothetical protein